jgi:hypothetical protein
MNLALLFISFVFFILLSPSVFFSILPGESKLINAAVHAMVFFIVLYIFDEVMKYSNRRFVKEGFNNSKYKYRQSRVNEAKPRAPTTRAPTTQAPTTRAPTTRAPTTRAPTTRAPTTRAPPLLPQRRIQRFMKR